MDEARLAERLIKDEGKTNYTYYCTQNHLTGGIGHKILENEPEYKQPVGSPVSKERVNEWFQHDMRSVQRDCERLYPSHWPTFDEDLKQIIANMVFQMGLGTMKKFVQMKKKVIAKDYRGAAVEMADSRWNRQTPNRAARLINEMKNLASDS